MTVGIQELHIYGFRSLKDVHWQPGKLNLLVGPNASGKSNVLRAIELISRAARGQLAETIADAGGMVPLLWNQSVDRLGWEATVDVPCDSGTGAIRHDLELRQIGTSSAYQISEDVFRAGGRDLVDGSGETYWQLKRAKGQPGFYETRRGHRIGFEDFDANESLLSQRTGDAPDLLSKAARRAIAQWRIHGDVRTGTGAPARLATTTQYVQELAEDGSNLTNVLHTYYTQDRNFETEIDEGMIAAFGTEYEKITFQPAASQQVQLAVRWKSSRHPHAAADLSDGTLRYLFLLTALAHPCPPGVIAIDEPETGLHPNMLPLVADYAAAAAERTQVIMTSHSPEFLDVFTEETSPTVTVCHWEEGETQLYPLTTETLKPWLERYRLGEMFTRGDLDILTLPDVEQSPELDAKLRALRQEA